MTNMNPNISDEDREMAKRAAQMAEDAVLSAAVGMKTGRGGMKLNGHIYADDYQATLIITIEPKEKRP